MKTRFLIISSLMLLMTMSFSEAYASCDSFIPVIHNIRAYDEASVVFFGTVTKAHELSSPESQFTGIQYEHTTFVVHHVFKGVLDENRVTTIPDNSAGYNGFVSGGTYFVYAYGPTNEVRPCTAPVIFPLALPVLIFHFY